MRQRLAGMTIAWKLTLKRVFVRKSFWVVLLLLPIMLVGLQWLESEEEAGLRAAVYSQDAIWREWLTQEGNPSFYFVDSISKLKTEVLRGNAECGYYIPEGLLEDFAQDDWYWKVEVYEGPQSMFTKLMNEALFSHIFQVVSSEWYLGYMEERLEEAGVVASEDEILQALSQKLLSGETFQVETIRVTETDCVEQENLDGEHQKGNERQESGQDASQTDTQSGSQLSARGVVAVMIYLTSLLAVMDVVRDREKKHFPAKQRLWAAFWTICHPTVMVAVVGMVGILVTRSGASVWSEVSDLLIFVILATMYGMVLSFVVRRESWMYGVIPVLFVASLVCCPVFVDFGSLIPVVRWIEKLFPLAFYL